jgi:hypothetical protein
MARKPKPYTVTVAQQQACLRGMMGAPAAFDRRAHALMSHRYYMTRARVARASGDPATCAACQTAAAVWRGHLSRRV